MSIPTLVVGRHPIGEALTPGRIAAHGLTLRKQMPSPVHAVFPAMVRDQAHAVCELAIVSAMQAVAFEKPLIPLPVTLAARYQHKCIVRNATKKSFGPEDLAGKRVAVRAYTQTTGAWVRALLQREYGIHPASVHWVTQTGAHVTEFQDPDFVEHVGPEHALVDLLEDGRVDAAIFGNDLPDLPWVVPVIPDAEAAGRRAFESNGVVPVNHILSVSKSWAEECPEHLAQVMALFRDAVASARIPAPHLFPIGLRGMRSAVEPLLASTYDQGLMPRPLSFDDLFAGAREVLGELAD